MEKENSQQQDFQNKDILMNIQTNLVVLDVDKQVAFKNKMFDGFVAEFIEQLFEVGHFLQEQVEGSEIWKTFINTKIFKLPKQLRDQLLDE